MSKPFSNIGFRFMSFFIRIRDQFSTPDKELLKLGILKEGIQLLDYGCGPGGYTIAAAKIVGKEGKVIAADSHPLARKYIDRRVKKNKLTNIKFIQTDCSTGLSDNSIDCVIFYDLLHMIEQPEKNLREFHRILKDEGILSMSCHHMKEEKILQSMTTNNIFKLYSKQDKIYNFKKEK